MCALLFVDMLSKYLLDGRDFNVLGKFLRFESLHNFGIAFGWFAGQKVIFIIVNCILTLGAIVAWWFMGRKSAWLNIGFALFIAGAIGNLYDRIVLGYVRDFLSFSFFPPVFNLADVFLTLGTAILVVVLTIDTFTDKKGKSDAS